MRIRNHGKIDIPCVGQSRPGKYNGMFGSSRTEDKNPFYGKQHNEETKRRMSKGRIGALPFWEHPFYKERPGYVAIHTWVKRRKGSAQQCSKCQKTNEETKVGWANKDHLYKRNLDDFFELCTKCHRQYDRKFNNQFKRKIGAIAEYEQSLKT